MVDVHNSIYSNDISTVKDSGSQAHAGVGTAISKSMENILSIDIHLSERIANSVKSGVYLLYNESQNNNRFSWKALGLMLLFMETTINKSPYRSEKYAPCVKVICNCYHTYFNGMIYWKKKTEIPKPWCAKYAVFESAWSHSVKLATKRIICNETSMKAKMLRVNRGKQMLYKQTKSVK